MVERAWSFPVAPDKLQPLEAELLALLRLLAARSDKSMDHVRSS